MGRKLVEAVPHFGGGELGPHAARCCLSRSLIRAKCHRDPSSRLATIDMAENRGSVPFFGRGGDASPSNTMSLGSRPTFLPSGILNPSSHLATADMDRELEAMPLWGGQLGRHLTQCRQVRGQPACHAHLDPSNRLATIHQRHNRLAGHTDRQDRTTV